MRRACKTCHKPLAYETKGEFCRRHYLEHLAATAGDREEVRKAKKCCRVCKKPLNSSNISVTGLCSEHYRSDPEAQGRRIAALKLAWKRPAGMGRPGRRYERHERADDADYRAIRSKGYSHAEAVELLDAHNQRAAA